MQVLKFTSFRRSLFKCKISPFRTGLFNIKNFCTNKNENTPSKDKETTKTSGKSSQSGGMSQQSNDSYQSDLMGTMGYMNTQYEEGFGLPIENLIVQDHTLIKTVYDKFKTCSSKEEAEKWRNELVYEIARHSIAEEIILYPLMRKKLPDGETLYQNSIKEHHEVKQSLYKAQGIDPFSEDFKKKVNDVMDLLMKHIQKEEKEILPSLTKNVSEEERIKAGNSFSRRKLIVPTRPHTMVPESPPSLNSILGLLTSPIDKFRDLFTSFPDQEKMSEIKKDAANKASSSTTSDKTNSKL
jgi:hemerythrin-like domain-containing protein